MDVWEAEVDGWVDNVAEALNFPNPSMPGVRARSTVHKFAIRLYRYRRTEFRIDRYRPWRRRRSFATKLSQPTGVNPTTPRTPRPQDWSPRIRLQPRFDLVPAWVRLPAASQLGPALRPEPATNRPPRIASRQIAESLGFFPVTAISDDQSARFNEFSPILNIKVAWLPQVSSGCRRYWVRHQHAH